VELVAKNGDWQTVTGLDTDFVISLKDETEVLLIEGEAIVQAQTDADEIDEKIIDSDEAVYIDDTGDISKMDADDFSDMWWEDGFYKTSGMTMILQSAAGLANKMILKAQNIRYSIYVILISVILLIFITLKSGRHKLLLWFFIIVMSAFSILMLYYFVTNMQIPMLNRIDNLLSGLTDAILKMGTGAILVFILLIGFISMLTGKKRRRGDTDNDYGDDYDLSDDDEDD
jgi:general stress protein CsbA